MSKVCHLVGLVVLAVGCGSAVSSALPAAAGQRPAAPSGAIGHDVGNVSCLGTLPADGSFGIIGTTAGRPFHPSGCLASEYAWANALRYRPQYYVNLADPGHKSTHWSQHGPRQCHPGPRYDAGCAFDYGYATAATAWSYLQAAGSSGRGRWWLDVEIDNTWGTSRTGIAANIADIAGAIHFLRSRPHTSVGVYTETAWWSQITDGTRAFAHLPVWGGGANSKRHARRNCRTHSITGGPALLAQWIAAGVDYDLAC